MFVDCLVQPQSSEISILDCHPWSDKHQWSDYLPHADFRKMAPLKDCVKATAARRPVRLTHPVYSATFLSFHYPELLSHYCFVNGVCDLSKASWVIHFVVWIWIVKVKRGKLGDVPFVFLIVSESNVKSDSLNDKFNHCVLILMPIKSRVKIRSTLEIYGASQRNSIASFSYMV